MFQIQLEQEFKNKFKGKESFTTIASFNYARIFKPPRERLLPSNSPFCSKNKLNQTLTKRERRESRLWLLKNPFLFKP